MKTFALGILVTVISAVSVSTYASATDQVVPLVRELTIRALRGDAQATDPANGVFSMNKLDLAAGDYVTFNCNVYGKDIGALTFPSIEGVRVTNCASLLNQIKDALNANKTVRLRLTVDGRATTLREITITE